MFRIKNSNDRKNTTFWFRSKTRDKTCVNDPHSNSTVWTLRGNKEVNQGRMGFLSSLLLVHSTTILETFFHDVRSVNRNSRSLFLCSRNMNTRNQLHTFEVFSRLSLDLRLVTTVEDIRRIVLFLLCPNGRDLLLVVLYIQEVRISDMETKYKRDVRHS